VENTPVNMNRAKISRMCGRNADFPLGPPISTRRENPTSDRQLSRNGYSRAIIAPSFPDAAEIPWAVDRYRVGKTSPGMTNVVVFGPKF